MKGGETPSAAGEGGKGVGDDMGGIGRGEWSETIPYEKIISVVGAQPCAPANNHRGLLLNVFFRRAAAEHLDMLLGFMRDYYAISGIPFDAVTQRSGLSGLIANRQHGYVWLIELEGAAVGYMAMCFGYRLASGGRDAVVEAIYLLPEARNQYIEVKAMQVMIDTCRSNGIQTMHVEINAADEAVSGFYEQAGFERRGFALMSRVVGG